jgi:O-antigen ligase
MLYVVGLALLFMVIEPFAGLILYLAFYFVRPWVFLPGFTGVPVLLVIGAAAFVNMLARQGIRRRSATLLKAPADYLLIWFFLAIMVSHLAHGRLNDALSYGSAFLHTIVAYLLITNLVDGPRRLRLVMQCLGVLMLWMAIQGVLLRYSGISVGGVTMYGERVRVLGLTGDPNLLAAGLLMVVPFLLWQTLRPSGFWTRVYSVIAVILMCHVVILTGSRGGIVALVVIGTVFLGRALGPVRAAVVGFAVVAGIYLFGPARLQEFGPGEPSAYGRLVAWERALGELRESPVFGIGSAQSGQGVEHVPHSAFLQAAAELGVFGLLAWVLLLFLSMKNGFFVASRAKRMGHTEFGSVMEALCFGFGAWIVALLFVGSPYYDEFYIMAALCVAGANIFVGMSPSRYRLIEKRDLGYAALLVVLGLTTHKLFLHIVGM